MWQAAQQPEQTTVIQRATSSAAGPQTAGSGGPSALPAVSSGFAAFSQQRDTASPSPQARPLSSRVTADTSATMMYVSCHQARNVYSRASVVAVDKHSLCIAGGWADQNRQRVAGAGRDGAVGRPRAARPPRQGACAAAAVSMWLPLSTRSSRRSVRRLSHLCYDDMCDNWLCLAAGGGRPRRQPLRGGRGHGHREAAVGAVTERAAGDGAHPQRAPPYRHLWRPCVPLKDCAAHTLCLNKLNNSSVLAFLE